MGWYGDPDELDRLAVRLRQRAELVRSSAADHQRAGEAARWVSASASAYRDVVARDRTRADSAAAALDAAAAAMSRHAEVVRERIALIARAEQAVVGWLEQRWAESRNAAARIAGGLVGAADDAVRALAQDPWRGLSFDPRRLPASGDVAWLDLHRSLGGRSA